MGIHLSNSFLVDRVLLGLVSLHAKFLGIECLFCPPPFR